VGDDHGGFAERRKKQVGNLAYEFAVESAAAGERSRASSEKGRAA
jgi:hypothetical protein